MTVEQQKSINIFSVSIDRLTIMGNIKKERLGDFHTLVNMSNWVDLWKMGQAAEGHIFKKVFFSYDPRKAQSLNRREFRMEFNPNGLSESEKKWIIEHIIPALEDVGLSRLDIAFDCDCNLGKFAYIQKISTKRTKIESRAGALETLYLGSRNSERMVRIYNKKVELEDRKNKIKTKLKNGINPNSVETVDDLVKELVEIEKMERDVWWRLEFELKRDAITIDGSIFDNLVIKEPVVNKRTVPRIQDRAMLNHLMQNENEWSELSKTSKAKFKKILQGLEGKIDEDLTERFKEALEKEKNDLLAQVAGWIGLEPNKLFI
ncbi:replication initiation factor domain-containing protein [Bacillus paranthracis]|uniref:replication initiation factor domain-containing protein n=1 Tax=Bacillus paranthracis TaxID=2026186 RepID=UPI002151B1CF|nr:replication initiation factor domain-containing protein [Bacillus paranthracis]MCR6463221.1 replication initiation factor domain-containing protein [Bacillus paranthracis]